VIRATLALACIAACHHDAAAIDPIKRGLTLVQAGSCNDCHTPMAFDAKLGMPVPQMDRMLSGHPANAPDPTTTLAKDDQAVIGPTFTSFALPFGVAYAANLTPDNETGLGAWTRDMFIGAMRTGHHMGMKGRPILPPMPWANLAQLSEDDLGAIYAYLRSVPPVSNRVPEPKVPQAVYAELDKQYALMLGAK
jgi:mono/diheme cytochrome c family protein